MQSASVLIPSRPCRHAPRRRRSPASTHTPRRRLQGAARGAARGRGLRVRWGMSRQGGLQGGQEARRPSPKATLGQGAAARHPDVRLAYLMLLRC